MTEAPSTVRDWEGRLQPGYLPFALAFGFLVLAFAYRALGLPSPSDVALVGQHLYASYGLITLFVAAFIEGLFFFGIYLPGSFVIVLAVHLAPKSFIPLATIAFVSAAGLLLSVGVNYWLGCYGGYRLLLLARQRKAISEMEQWFEVRGALTLPLAAALPNLLAVAAVCAGIAKSGAWRTIKHAGTGLAIWIPLWTIAMALVLSRVSIEDPNQHWYIVLSLIVWGVARILWKWCTQVLSR